MANSEKVDFEGADEEVMKFYEDQFQSCEKKKRASLESKTNAHAQALTQSDNNMEQSNNAVGGNISSIPHPDSLGAKPKTLQKNKAKSHSKHRGHRDAMDTSADSGPKKRLGTSKWDDKTRVKSSEMIASENNNKYKGKSRGPSRLYTSDASFVKHDMNDTVEPLVEQLASLDVHDTSDKTTMDSSMGMSTDEDDRSLWKALATLSDHIDSNKMKRFHVEDHFGVSCYDFEGLPPAMVEVLKMLEERERLENEILFSSEMDAVQLQRKVMKAEEKGDPLLKKTKLFSKDKPLSQTLREAREKAELKDKETKQVPLPEFEALFEDFRGLAPLEALETLSNTCATKMEGKLDSLSGTPMIEFERKLMLITAQCELLEDDEDDYESDDCGRCEDRGNSDVLERELTTAMQGFGVPVSHSKILRVCEDTDTWLTTMKCIQEDDIDEDNEDWFDDDDCFGESDPLITLTEMKHQAVRALARFTAAVIEYFHKTAELLMKKDTRNSELECQSLVVMIKAIFNRVSYIAMRYAELISSSAHMIESEEVDRNEVNMLITHVFCMGTHTSTIIQESSVLLVRLIQLGAVQ